MSHLYYTRFRYPRAFGQLGHTDRMREIDNLIKGLKGVQQELSPVKPIEVEPPPSNNETEHAPSPQPVLPEPKNDLVQNQALKTLKSIKKSVKELSKDELVRKWASAELTEAKTSLTQLEKTFKQEKYQEVINKSNNILKFIDDIRNAATARRLSWEKDHTKATELVIEVENAISDLKNNQLVNKWEQKSLNQMDDFSEQLNSLLRHNDFSGLNEVALKATKEVKKIAEKAAKTEQQDKERFKGVQCLKSTLEKTGLPFKIRVADREDNKSDVIIAIGFDREKQLDVNMELNGSVKMKPQGVGYQDHSCRNDMKKILHMLHQNYGIKSDIQSTDPEPSASATITNQNITKENKGV